MPLPCCHCRLCPAAAAVLPSCQPCCFLPLSCHRGRHLRCCAVASTTAIAAAGLMLPDAAAAALLPLPLRCLLKHHPAAATLPLPPCCPFAAAVLPLPISLCRRHCRAATATSALPPPLPPLPPPLLFLALSPPPSPSPSPWPSPLPLPSLSLPLSQGRTIGRKSSNHDVVCHDVDQKYICRFLSFLELPSIYFCWTDSDVRQTDIYFSEACFLSFLCILGRQKLPIGKA